MRYKVIAYIDELDYTLGENIDEEQLEDFLHTLTRKQDYKNVKRFDLIQLDVEETDNGKVHVHTIL